jgi:hypothetical protein
MRKTILLSCVCIFVLCFGVSAQAGPVTPSEVSLGTYNSPEDFKTFFWKEMFKGGGPGQAGNTLMALGKGFIFKRAVLDNVESGVDPNEFITTYINGVLVLNSKGPWLNRKKLIDRDILATNESIYDPDTGMLTFTLTFCGEFDNAEGVFYRVVAEYSGAPEIKFDDEGYPVLQRGTEFVATIELSDSDLCESQSQVTPVMPF